MTFSHRSALTLAALFGLFPLDAAAQAPAAPPPASAPAIPSDVSPLFVVTYVEAMPTARDEAAALLKSYRDASRAAAGNVRSVVVQRPRRPGQFVIVAAWKDKAAWDSHSAATATKEFRDKLHGLRSVPADDRFHNALAVGPLEIPQTAPGAVYVVSHVDAINARKDDAVVALKVMADASRSAAGNLRYEVVQQTNRPNHFTVFEVWRSREALDTWSMSPQARDFRDRMASMIGALYDDRLYEILN